MARTRVAAKKTTTTSLKKRVPVKTTKKTTVTKKTKTSSKTQEKPSEGGFPAPAKAKITFKDGDLPTVKVDEQCTRSGKVARLSSGDILSATLNLSNVSGNNNKFYKIQLIEYNGRQFTLFCKWGRVGSPGATSFNTFSDFDKCYLQFTKKLHAKQDKGYKLIEIDVGGEEDKNGKKIDPNKKMEEDLKKCSLPVEVSKVVMQMFDSNMMNQVMKDIGYDSRKMPLGKLSSKAIDNAYGILSKLMGELEKFNCSKTTIDQLSSDFYTQIPHDFGFQKLSFFTLNSKIKVQEKLDFLDSLKNMKIANDMNSTSVDTNLIEENYKKLKCGMQPIPKKSAKFKLLNDYL